MDEVTYADQVGRSDATEPAGGIGVEADQLLLAAAATTTAEEQLRDVAQSMARCQKHFELEAAAQERHQENLTLIRDLEGQLEQLAKVSEWHML